MKAIHNSRLSFICKFYVVLYPKDTEKWKQFTTQELYPKIFGKLFCIPKILKNESNSQQSNLILKGEVCCFVSQRYWKMKAIHNQKMKFLIMQVVVLYPKDTEKWKQFTTCQKESQVARKLFCIPKILKNESNSQQRNYFKNRRWSCFVSQRYWKMKAIHNWRKRHQRKIKVVLYPKDTEKWKQFTT